MNAAHDAGESKPGDKSAPCDRCGVVIPHSSPWGCADATRQAEDALCRSCGGTGDGHPLDDYCNSCGGSGVAS